MKQTKQGNSTVKVTKEENSIVRVIVRRGNVLTVLLVVTLNRVKYDVYLCFVNCHMFIPRAREQAC